MDCELSIIVPVYNVSGWLEQCLDSILNQTWKNFEVICVDDGSTDNSLEILERYRCMDSRITVIHKENGGLVSARKAGISVASGRYATYVDSDDWIDKEMYQCLMEKALETNADIVTSGIVLEYSNGSIVEMEEMEEGVYDRKRLKEIFYPNMISAEEFFVQKVSIHIFNKIYDTKLLKYNQTVIPDNITIGEDAACVYPSFLCAEKIMVLHKAFYHYRMRESSMMGMCNCNYERNSSKILYSYLNNRFSAFSYNFLNEQLCRLITYMILMTQPDILWKGGDIVPYGKIKRGRIVLYGMGRFGKAFKSAIEKREGYEIVALMDENRKSIDSGEECYSLKEFMEQEIDYDYVLVTILKRNLCRTVRDELCEIGIKNEKIKEPELENIQEIVRMCIWGIE